jgi:hypothetical protein
MNILSDAPLQLEGGYGRAIFVLIEKTDPSTISAVTVKLSSQSIETIAGTLGARIERTGSDTVLYIGPVQSSPSIVLTITFLSDGNAVLSAQTIHGYFELHNVERFVLVEPDEVIFVAETGERISGLVVGREATCSLFANVDSRTLSADFTVLEPALLLAAMQLGLVENVPSE